VTVGLLGGAFDPPHFGHVALARTAVRDLGLDRLLVVVLGTAPHKHVETDAETRFRLAEAAFSTLPRVELSRHEIEREGLSYTVDTARWAGAELDDVVVVVGADEFADFLSWKDPDGILEHVRLAVATRPGYPRERLDEVRERLARPDRVQYVELPPVAVASRDVRASVAAGLPVDELVPEAVARLIDELSLYRPG
jgi:nicotinate-nucleotide adenylyltransferase